VVLCPGWNDGAALDQTLLDLAALAPAARSVALVPVGLTRHRAGLPDLAPFDAPRAAALLERAHGHQARFRAQLGTAFVFAADELYCLSGTPLPSDAAYENYPQLENGVGLLRAFEGEFVRAFEDGTAEGGLRPADAPPRRVTLVTGVSAAPFLRALLARCPIPGLSVDVRAVVNRFFGETVTVAGLLTGQDLRAQLPPLETDALLLPANMLRDDGLFLDDMTLAELERGLGLPIQVVACDGAALLDALAR
jgi:putative radical SAM enzyme (TIGR03279 family)